MIFNLFTFDPSPLTLQDVSEGSEEDDELTIPASDSSDDSDSEGDLDEAASLASSVAELSSGTLACIPYFSMLST